MTDLQVLRDILLLRGTLGRGEFNVMSLSLSLVYGFLMTMLVDMIDSDYRRVGIFLFILITLSWAYFFIALIAARRRDTGHSN